MVQTSSIASQMKTNNKLNAKKESDLDYSDAMSLMEKNHERAATADVEEHDELNNENLTILKKLLAHYLEHQKKGTFPGPANAEMEKGEKAGEDLQKMINDLKKDIAGMVKQAKNMKAYIAKMIKSRQEAVKAQADREVGMQKVHEFAVELRQNMTDPEQVREWNFATRDNQPTNSFRKVNEECRKEKEELQKKRKEEKGDEEEEDSFLQTEGDNADAAAQGVGMAKACTAGFMTAFPPTFAFKRGGDFGKSDFYADGYHRQGALYYKNCKSGYSNVLGVCWGTCKSGYTNFGMTCTRCSWEKCKVAWWHVPCLKCHTYGKPSYTTHIITLFDSRVKCRNSKHYKSAALCYRDCKYNEDGNVDSMQNCGIGACATSTGACVAGIINLAAELILGMVQFIAFVASWGTAGAGANQAAGSAAKNALAKMGNKAKFAWASAKRMATDRVFRETAKKSIVKSAKAKFKEDFGNAALGKYVELHCRSVADKLLDDMKDKQDYDLKNLDFTGITGAVSSCSGDPSKDSVNNGTACARGIFTVLSNVDPTGLSTIAAAVLQPSVPR